MGQSDHLTRIFIAIGLDRSAGRGYNSAVMTPHPDRSSLAPRLVLALGIAAVSSASLFIRWAQQDASSLAVAAWRLILASLLLLPWAGLRHGKELRRLKPSDWGWTLASGAFLAIHFAAWISSLEYTGVASSVVLVSTSPLWVALASWLFMREKPGRGIVAGMALAMAGGLVVALDDSCRGGAAAPLLGNGLALLGALAAAGYWLIGRKLRRSLALVPYVAVVYATAALLLLILALGSGGRMSGFRAGTWGCFLLLALLPQLVGHSSFNWALAHLPAAAVAVATLGEPIGATLLAYLVLGESPTVIKLAGATAILAGIVVALLRGPAPQNRHR
jgi:drug/metabolite transporter (DMT)-like permease